jgi:hypothetical protein
LLLISVNRDLTPQDGARLLLERERADDTRAEYRAAIFTPEAMYDGRAVIGEDGSVELAIEGAPRELAEALHVLARLTARSAAKKRADGLPPWPARVLRWRPRKVP